MNLFVRQTLPSECRLHIALPDTICNSLVEVIRSKDEEFDALNGQCARGQRERGEEQAERWFSEHIYGESHAECAIDVSYKEKGELRPAGWR